MGGVVNQMFNLLGVSSLFINIKVLGIKIVESRNLGPKKCGKQLILDPYVTPLSYISALPVLILCLHLSKSLALYSRPPPYTILMHYMVHMV